MEENHICFRNKYVRLQAVFSPYCLYATDYI